MPIQIWSESVVRADEETICSFEDFPDELILLILRFSEPKDLGRIAQCSHRLNQLVEEVCLWKGRPSGPLHRIIREHKPRDWKKFCMEREVILRELIRSSQPNRLSKVGRRIFPWIKKSEQSELQVTHPVKKARKLIRQKKYAEALVAFQFATADEMDQPLAKRLLAEALYHTHQIEEARSWYEAYYRTDHLPQFDRVLAQAVYENDAALTRILLESGAHWDNEHPFLQSSVVGLAFEQMNEEVLEALLDAGMPVDYQLHPDTGLDSAIFSAIEKGNPAAVQLLIERGSDLTMTDRYGRTPYERAMETGNYELLAPFFDGHAHVDQRHRISGKTALIYAAQLGDIETILFLLERNADRDIRVGFWNRSALHYARNSNVRRFLREYP